ncbi:hypothetical protein FGG08_006188 [Glutinoglossum americanum]|uniref:Cyclin N-terminal domain-containing protein n=1 Tax=Glutinoglossum americanum TaxID=1670608 RepID=A0A9P8I7W6_9PEZI|nr:hypothetical protein FGG08_006188 [Glutinoglossum americanum]
MACQPAFYYGHCDSFFVESHDDGVFASHGRVREHAELVARERQFALADELTRLARAQYEEDIMEHMEDMEAVTLPDVSSIDIQQEIQWFMRPYLIDFLIEAHVAFQLLPETLFLAINLLDRYCSKRVVYKRHYQLVGCASLLIAAKYGDKKERVPSIKDLKSMCCSLYEEDMFIQMEWHVLQTVNWIIGHPTVDAFLQPAFHAFSYDVEVKHMTMYICEIALFHRDFVSTRSSMLARVAFAVARNLLGRARIERTNWAVAEDDTTYQQLLAEIRRPSPILSRKYASTQYSSVSTVMDEVLLRRAAIANRRYYTPSIPEPEAPRVECQGSYVSKDHGVQTPQKGHYPPSMTAGLVTPPITPDNDNFHDINAGRDVPPPCPLTPSPSGTRHGEQYENPQVQRNFLHPHYQPSPQLDSNEMQIDYRHYDQQGAIVQY